MRSYDCDTHQITYEDITDGEQVITISGSLWWTLMQRWLTALVKAYLDWQAATARYNAIISGGSSELPSGQIPSAPADLVTASETVLAYLDGICNAVETKEEAAARVAERLAILTTAKQWIRNLGDVRAVTPASQPWYGVTYEGTQYAIGITTSDVIIQLATATRQAL